MGESVGLPSEITAPCPAVTGAHVHRLALSITKPVYACSQTGEWHTKQDLEKSEHAAGKLKWVGRGTEAIFYAATSVWFYLAYTDFAGGQIARGFGSILLALVVVTYRLLGMAQQRTYSSTMEAITKVMSTMMAAQNPLAAMMAGHVHTEMIRVPQGFEPMADLHTCASCGDSLAPPENPILKCAAGHFYHLDCLIVTPEGRRRCPSCLRHQSS